MAHFIRVLTAEGEEVDDLNVSGDLTAFYNYFGAEKMNRATNGDGNITVSVDGIKNFLMTENKNPGPRTAETLLRNFLSNVVENTTELQLVLDLQ